MSKMLAACATALMLAGCKAPLVFNNPSVQTASCVIDAAVLPELESLAASLGLPLALVEDLYKASCSLPATRLAAEAIHAHRAELAQHD